ncbi:MAG: glutamate racemase, partial [Actinobacteria bacterium]|nr:glutamate racemase [Actinomycetota bacterium]
MAHRPIGMFDSGFGGLTVARALIDLMPNEDLVYVGDTGRYPYGSKPADEVRGYAIQIAWSLVRDFDAKAIVVACNTASAVAYDALVKEMPVPVLEVINPGAR